VKFLVWWGVSEVYLDEHTEEILSLHEKEIKQLKEERRMKAPLLASIKKYFEICEEEKELAAAASDQTRLLGRGPRDPGRLLREQKMRKRVSKEKPRVRLHSLRALFDIKPVHSWNGTFYHLYQHGKRTQVAHSSYTAKGFSRFFWKQLVHQIKKTGARCRVLVLSRSDLLRR
jgi:hypothetical protein